MDPTGVQREDSQGNRYYVLPTDHKKRPKRFPSVTRIISEVWPSGGLENWKIGNIAVHVVDNAEEIGAKLLHLAERGPTFRDIAKEQWKEKFVGWKDDFTAANKGTRIHAGLESFYKEKTHLTDLAAVMAYNEYLYVENALKCIQDHGIKVLMMEIPVYGNSEYAYAGTVDILAKIGDDYCVVDLKTGKRLNRSYIAQIGAYAKADVGYANGRLKKWPNVTRGFILKASATDAQLYEIDLDLGWMLFTAACHVYEQAHTTGGMTKV